MPLIAPKALQGLYFFCEPLAEGSFGVLYVAIHAITRQKVAVKILDKRKLGSDAYRVRSEIEALKQLNHKYIYKLYQVVETQSYFYLVVEYLPGGELFDYILQKEHLSEVEARVIFRQIVSAIGYIHSKGFAHRDLKPENILLDNDQNVRIIDFGLCAKSNDVTMLNTFCGSFAYAAPEVLANREYSGSAADLWSLGVILYALLCGCLPFDPTKPEELPQKIGKGVFAVPDSLSKSSRHLLSQLMCVDPKKRIKIDELRRHPWIVEGFMGHPVDLDEEKVPMSPLNMHIVGEITAYTRIPKVEVARMLQKRSYDYLMATYMIMESALEEEDVFIRLQRRTQPVGYPMVSTTYSGTSRPAQDHRISTTIPTSTPAHSSKPLDHNAAITQASVTFRLPLTENSSHNVMDNMENDHRILPNSMSMNTQKPSQPDYECPSSADSSQIYELESHSNENRYPIVPVDSDHYSSSSHQNEKLNFGKRMPVRGPDNGETRDLPALSPSRSIDSQLAYLTQEMYGTSLMDKVLPVSVTDRYDSELPVLFSTVSSNLNHEIGSLHSNPGILADDISQSSNEDCGISVPGPSNGWRRFGRIRNALTPKKPMTDGRVVVDRIRKTRHLNNVLLIRKDLSPGQAFDRIASALRQQSIRFTLKGSGFLCIFANDWGKTVLSFELELVYVSARAVEAANSSIKRRLTLKPRSHGSKSPARFVKPSPSGQECPPIASNSSKSSGVSNHSTTQAIQDLPLPANHLLGVKMKRIRGDSFMYTSLCRTILDCADIRQSDEFNQNELSRNKSPSDEAYVSLSKGNLSETDDSTCENLQIQFRASSTPRQPSVSYSKLKPIENKRKLTVEHDIETRSKFPDPKKNYRKQWDSSYNTLIEQTQSSGFNGDNSVDFSVPDKTNCSTSKPIKLIKTLSNETQEQQFDSQPLDLRTNKSDSCLCANAISGTTNPIPFDIQTLLSCNQGSRSISSSSQNCQSIFHSNILENNSNRFTSSPNMILKAMTEFFILLQQQQQQQLEQKHSTSQPTTQQMIEPRWSSHQSDQSEYLSLPCLNTFASPCTPDSIRNLHEYMRTQSEQSWPIHLNATNPVELESHVIETMGLRQDLMHPKSGLGIISTRDQFRSDENCNPHIQESLVSNFSDSIAESRELKSEDNCDNELGGKGPAIFYFPEPDNSKEKIQAMIQQNDPRLKYVNDGAAIRNPFAVDRKTQLNHLTALLCVKLDNNCYLCKGCNRTTSRLRPMQQHLLSHSASKFNLCVRCLKGFNDKYDMKRHTRKHTLVRPYVCPECNRSFSQRCSLEGHRKKIHKIKLDFTPNQRREVVRVCENCGYACSRLVDMVNHTATYHSSSTSLPRLKRQLSRYEDRVKRNRKHPSHSKPLSNLLSSNEPVTEFEDSNLEK